MDEHNPSETTQHFDDSIEESKWKPLITKLMGAFLVLILIVYSLTIFVDIPGYIGSTKINESVLKTDDTTIIFAKNTYDDLLQEYLENQHREIKACLFGTVHEGTYTVNEVLFPAVQKASVVHVLAEQCPGRTIIDLHSHPWRQCTASAQDLRVFDRLRASNPDILMMIMCTTERFTVYGADL